MVLRGTYCSFGEGESRAIARYGSTVGKSEVTGSGQGATVDDKGLEGLGILDVWEIVRELTDGVAVLT